MTIIKGLIIRTLQILRRADYILFYLFFRVFCKADRSQVLMLSDSRQELSGNLWFIDRELRARGFQPAYYLKKNLREKKSIAEKLRMCRDMARAQTILVDDFYPLIYPIPLRKETRLIQVWHAMGAYKTVGFSRLGTRDGANPLSITHRNYTDAIVSAESIRKDYAEAFRMPVERVHALGVPRTDIFWDREYAQQVRSRLCEKYPILQGKKVLLFAPTFRGRGQNEAHYPYEWIDFTALQQTFGDEYVCIIKMHPFIRKLPEKLDPSFYLDLSGEREINDLLFLTDILITDYSSVIFEASVLKIPTVFYVPDLQEYIRDRDFYYPFPEYTYGKCAHDFQELLCCLKEPSVDQNRLAAFTEKFCSACDGHSAERFVDYFMG